MQQNTGGCKHIFVEACADYPWALFQADAIKQFAKDVNSEPACLKKFSWRHMYKTIETLSDGNEEHVREVFLGKILPEMLQNNVSPCGQFFTVMGKTHPMSKRPRSKDVIELSLCDGLTSLSDILKLFHDRIEFGEMKRCFYTLQQACTDTLEDARNLCEPVTLAQHIKLGKMEITHGDYTDNDFFLSKFENFQQAYAHTGGKCDRKVAGCLDEHCSLRTLVDGTKHAHLKRLHYPDLNNLLCCPNPGYVDRCKTNAMAPSQTRESVYQALFEKALTKWAVVTSPELKFNVFDKNKALTMRTQRKRWLSEQENPLDVTRSYQKNTFTKVTVYVHSAPINCSFCRRKDKDECQYNINTTGNYHKALRLVAMLIDVDEQEYTETCFIRRANQMLQTRVHVRNSCATVDGIMDGVQNDTVFKMKFGIDLSEMPNEVKTEEQGRKRRRTLPKKECNIDTGGVKVNHFPAYNVTTTSKEDGKKLDVQLHYRNINVSKSHGERMKTSLTNVANVMLGSKDMEHDSELTWYRQVVEESTGNLLGSLPNFVTEVSRLAGIRSDTLMKHVCFSRDCVNQYGGFSFVNKKVGYKFLKEMGSGLSLKYKMEEIEDNFALPMNEMLMVRETKAADTSFFFKKKTKDTEKKKMKAVDARTTPFINKVLIQDPYTRSVQKKNSLLHKFVLKQNMMYGHFPQAKKNTELALRLLQ